MGRKGKSIMPIHPPTHYCKILLLKNFFISLFSNTQFKTNNSVEIFASNACKIFILQHIGLLIKSKFWNMVFLWFGFLLATKCTCPDFIWPKNVLDSVGFYWIFCFVLLWKQCQVPTCILGLTRLLIIYKSLANYFGISCKSLWISHKFPQIIWKSLTNWPWITCVSIANQSWITVNQLQITANHSQISHESPQITHKVQLGVWIWQYFVSDSEVILQIRFKIWVGQKRRLSSHSCPSRQQKND